MVKHGTGNWQTRHDALQAKRQAAKLRKQQSDENKGHRKRVQACWTKAMEHVSQDTSSIHLWVSQPPQGYHHDEESIDISEASNSTHSTTTRPRSVSWQNYHDVTPSKRRDRSHSMGENPPGKGRRRSQSFGESAQSASSTKGRRRSQSFHEKPVHPRSKEQPASPSFDEDSSPTVWICKAHLFTGKCLRGKRKYTCGLGLTHLEEAETLCRWVTDPQQVSQAQANAPDSTLQFGALPAVYYVKYNNALPDTMSLSDWLAKHHQLSLADIVYMVVDGVLIFDAQQEPDNNILTEFNVLAKLRGKDTATVSSCPQKLAETVLFRMHPILWEHILAYLPDEAVGLLSQVCQRWRQDFTQNPRVWQYLLQRNGWPGSSRQDFVPHYRVVRNVRAVRRGLEERHFRANAEVAITTLPPRPSIIVSEEDENVLHDDGVFLPPWVNVNAVCLLPWSAGQVLVGTKYDCTLRLLDVCTKADGTSEKHCRTLLCRNVDIYAHTRRIRSSMTSVALDQHNIVCLLLCAHVDATPSPSSSKLIIIPREYFLTHETLILEEQSSSRETDESDVEDQVQIVDLEKKILDYLVEHNQGLDHVWCDSHHSLLVCGPGLFMFIATVRGRNQEDMVRRLYLFSGNQDRIIWSYLLPLLLPATVSLVPGESDKYVLSHHGEMLVFTVQGETAQVVATEPALLPNIAKDANSAQREVDEVGGARFLVTRNYILTFQDHNSGQRFKRGTLCSIRHCATTEDAEEKVYRVILPGSLQRSYFLGDGEYAVFVSVRFEERPDDSGVSVVQKIRRLLTVHLPSASVLETVEISHATGLIMTECFETVFAYISIDRNMPGGRVILTGDAVRQAPLDGSLRTSKKRQSSKRRVKGKQKDGFQRGKSRFG